MKDTMNSRARLFFLVLVTITTSAAQTNKAQVWQEYVFPADGFAITAPARPNIRPDPEAADVSLYRWELSPGVLFAVHAGVRTGCREIITRFKLAAANNASGEFVAGSLKDISLSGNPGVEYASHLKTGRDSFERLYCAENKAYSLTLGFPAGEAKPVIADRMFDSFRFLKREAH